MVKIIRDGPSVREVMTEAVQDVRRVSEADLQVSPVFVVNQIAFKSGKYRYIVNQGGARSGKTYSILQIILLYVLRNHDKIVDIFRKTHAELAETVVQDFIDIIASLGLSDVVKRNKTKHIFTVNGNVIRFLGIDKAQKRRGSRRDLAYMNEANGMTLDDFVQIKIRTAEAVFLDFNPSEYFWANEQILEKENKDDNRHILIKSTYLDNYDFLPYDQIKDIESLIEIDDFYYQVYVLGNLAVMKGKIYTRQELIEPEVYDVVDFDELYYGLDFGHINPMALIECKYAQEQSFERERYYQAGKHPEDLVKWMIENEISQTAPIYADPAYPSGIAKLRDAGFNVRRAKKDVVDGIAYCQGIVPKICKSSTHYIRERQGYKWRQTVSGSVLEGEPVKINDHLVDAERYAQYTHRKRLEG